ncbi:MAG: sacsin N-terminal ATP-binding-like domain-containing protein [Chroococcales cyanobacterium]
MVNSDRPLGGKSFYQSETLIARLRGIIRDYPEGVGILKELIQNADDAKATRVEIILDWRTHSGDRIPNFPMKALMGPAILVYNDQVFQDKDFESIRHLGQSEKAQDLQKTGRFGIGFNAIYHVTDYPSFVSRDRLIFFDPHGFTIPGTSKQQPGREWKFSAEGWYDDYPDFMKIYEPGKLSFGTENFSGTLFRLPLRTAEQAKSSELRKQPFEKSNVQELIDELIQDGEELLLFLKSVLEIRVYEIPANGDGTKKEILSIITQNSQDVKEARQKLLNSLPDNSQTLLNQCRQQNPLVSISYRHEIETLTPTQKTSSTWRVVSLIRLDQQNELAPVIEAMHEQQEKVVPWAGAAARINHSSTNGNNNQPINGRIYCFLPLPVETGLPIHINGFFNLNSSRDNLSSDSGQTGKDKPRAIWNSLLVRHVLAEAYTNLIIDLVSDIGQYNPEFFYSLFPTQKVTISKALESLSVEVIKRLYTKKVIHSAVEHSETKVENGETIISQSSWITPQQVRGIPTRWKKLIPPLTADKIEIAQPELSESLLSAFKEAGCPILTYKPANLRQHLRQNQALGVKLEDAPFPSLRQQEWIIDLLEYCISDSHRDLTGLPLALLADETLQVFGYHPIGTVYIASKDVRGIFADYKDWFLHSSLQNKLSSVYKGVSDMTPAEVVKKLETIFQQIPSDALIWDSVSPSLPNAEWLTKVYSYLTSLRELPTSALQKLPLIPGNDGKLYPAEGSFQLLFDEGNCEAETKEALGYFNIPLFSPNVAFLKNAIATFLEKHPNTLIYPITGPNVVTLLNEKISSLPPYDEKHFPSLLNFLAQISCVTGEERYNETQKSILRQLPIYLTNTDELVSLNDADVYLPGNGYDAPAIAITFRLLQLGKSHSNWLSLFKMLNVPVLNRATLIQDCLLRDYPTLAPNEQEITLTWIRDNLENTLEELKQNNENQQQFLDQLSGAPLVRCQDGRLRAVRTIYSPNSTVIQSLLGSKAAIPDVNLYTDAKWFDFFKRLGMQEIPNANDLVNCVENIIQTANRYGVEEVTEDALALFEYIGNNWEQFRFAVTKENVSFLDAIKDKAWLPVIRDPNILKEYPGAKLPELRLYRPSEVSCPSDALLVASCRPVFARQEGKLPSVEIRNALGFSAIQLEEVLAHFENLLQLEVSEKASILPAVREIYSYLYTHVVKASSVTEEEKQRIQSRFCQLPCLWDEVTGKFWKPIHGFSEDVSFFGNRRVTIHSQDHLSEVEALLGKKRSPDIEDYIRFLEEVAEDYSSSPLNPEDTQTTITVLKRLDSLIALKEEAVKNIPILTANCQLQLSNRVFIPDAPWRKDYIPSNSCLHSEINPKFASSVGCLSLLKDVKEIPTEVKSSVSFPNAEEWCQRWENTLKSPEFEMGLRRLIFHEKEIEGNLNWEWLKLTKVIPTSEINTDLFYDTTKIASEIPGIYYFDQSLQTIYLAYSEKRSLMSSYLAEILNIQLEEYSLNNLLPLALILNSPPNTIHALLNELRIRDFGNRRNLNAPSVPPEEDKKDDSFGKHIYWGSF